MLNFLEGWATFIQGGRVIPESRVIISESHLFLPFYQKIEIEILYDSTAQRLEGPL